MLFTKLMILFSSTNYKSNPTQMCCFWLITWFVLHHQRLLTYRQLRARRALLQCKDVPLRTRRALLLYKVYGNSALLVLNGTSLNCNNALLARNWQYIYCPTLTKGSKSWKWHFSVYKLAKLCVILYVDINAIPWCFD